LVCNQLHTPIYAHNKIISYPKTLTLLHLVCNQLHTPIYAHNKIISYPKTLTLLHSSVVNHHLRETLLSLHVSFNTLHYPIYYIIQNFLATKTPRN